MLSTEEKEPDAFHREEEFMRDWPTNFSTRTVVNTPEYKVTRVRLERIATGGMLCA